MLAISTCLLFVVVFCSSAEWNNNSDAAKQLTQNRNHSTSKTHPKDYDEWITSNVLMPRYGDGMAIGSYGDSIYILGGINVEFQLIRYDITGHKMVDFGAKYLPSAVSGYGQFYSVTNNIMYIITGTSSVNKLSTFNLKTATFTKNWDNINVPHSVGIGSCIVSNDAFLFIIGGFNRVTLNTLQILSIENHKWSSHPPSMLESRNYLTCNINIHPQSHDTVYAIGGYQQNNQGLEYLDTVEYIIMKDNAPPSLPWKYISGRLLYPTESARSVVYGTSILVIGGQFYDQHQHRRYLNNIQVIDTVSGQVTDGGTLDKPIENTAAIITNYVIYAFGGFYNGSPLDQWQYCQLTTPTNAPTDAPTDAPTNAPTNAPTKSPTNAPTNAPTNTSTNAPTKSPTESPTNAPTNAPTHSPTLFPTASPGHYPSKRPTKSPTMVSSSESILVPLLIITILLMLIISIICLRVLYVKKRMKNGSIIGVSRFDSKRFFKSLQIASKNKALSIFSRDDVDYMPMITIDENNELGQDKMHEHDVVNNLLFQEQIQPHKKKQDQKQPQKSSIVIFGGTR